MLDAGNRQALTQQLRPPAGFRLVHAVGTTFTLDMTSALAVPLSFVSGSGEQFTNSVAVLTALRKVADRVDIFCQAGNIRVPQDASDLLALLEPMIHQVSARRGGLFHPKVWVLEFENDDGERRYRFLCSSRNLTPDTSWDLLVRLDGAPTNSAVPSNTPLSRFLTALSPMASVRPEQTRIDRITDLAERIATVEWELPEHISSLAFRPLGVQSEPEPASLVSYLRNPQTAAGLNPDPGAAKTIGYKKLVISPFLDEKLLRRLIDVRTDQTHVFSRADQLDLLPSTVISNKRLCFRSFDDTVTPETGDDGVPNSAGDLTGLHAKAYFCDYGFQTHVLLGSSNATDAGFNTNVEFLVEMKGLKSRIGVDEILNSLKDVPFTDYAGEGGKQPSNEDKTRFQLETELQKAAAGSFVLDAVKEQGPDSSGRYAVSLEHHWTPPPQFSATVRLVTLRAPVFEVLGPSERPATNLVFRQVPLADVTPYLVLGLTDKESGLSATAVVQGVLRTDPEGRLEEVIARQLDNPDKLRQFLLLFLSPEDAPPPGSGLAGLSWHFRSGYETGSSAGLYEALITALENPNAPDVFSDLEPVIQRLVQLNGDSDEVLQLQALWSAAVEALQVKEMSHGL
ncbi:phospholipase D family protein [Arthrobacter luteolus]|uniref:phospholipase D family protein n=1 Tax=Arthrobacter luteolus TaxID=98672 RepID=UPI00384D31F5